MLEGAVGVGVADCPPEGEGVTLAGPDTAGDGDAAGDDDTVGGGDTAGDDTAGDGDTASVTVGDAATEGEDGLGLPWLAGGATETVPGCLATTATPSARRPTTAMGTRATRRPSGKGSKQLGQKPDTGVVV